MIGYNAPKEIQDYFYDGQEKRRYKIAHIDEKYATILIDRGVQWGFEKYFCGYTWFKLDEIPKEWHEYSDIEYDMDIHGGLTYSNIVGDYIIYGFDCAHLNDERNPRLQDELFILDLCQVMRSEIISAIPKWCNDKESEIIELSKEIIKLREVYSYLH